MGPLARSAIGLSVRPRFVGSERPTARRWQGQFIHQTKGLCTRLFRLGVVSLLFVPTYQRLQGPRQVGLHAISAVVIEGVVEVVLGTLEVARSSIPFSESLGD